VHSYPVVGAVDGGQFRVARSVGATVTATRIVEQDSGKVQWCVVVERESTLSHGASGTLIKEVTLLVEEVAPLDVAGKVTLLLGKVGCQRRRR